VPHLPQPPHQAPVWRLRSLMVKVSQFREQLLKQPASDCIVQYRGFILGKPASHSLRPVATGLATFPVFLDLQTGPRSRRINSSQSASLTLGGWPRAIGSPTWCSLEHITARTLSANYSHGAECKFRCCHDALESIRVGFADEFSIALRRRRAVAIEGPTLSTTTSKASQYDNGAKSGSISHRHQRPRRRKSMTNGR
jgi:hypothetical protein